jgi:hypothetical protein
MTSTTTSPWTMKEFLYLDNLFMAICSGTPDEPDHKMALRVHKKIIKMKPNAHNQCDICGKKFNTALGFHRHYPLCLERGIISK